MTALEELIRIQTKDYAEKHLACSNVKVKRILPSGSGRWNVEMTGENFGEAKKLVVYVRQVPGDEDAIEAYGSNIIS